MNTRILIISASLNPSSYSRILAEQARSYLQSLDQEIELDYLDLREVDLPFCDGHAHARLDPSYSARIKEADGVIIASPVYNFDLNAAIKALLEMTGKAWTDTTVGFICAAGGKSSYMSVMPMANSLMLDFRCLILPRFVYATGQDFQEGQPVEELACRLSELCDEMQALTVARQISRQKTSPRSSV